MTSIYLSVQEAFPNADKRGRRARPLQAARCSPGSSHMTNRTGRTASVIAHQFPTIRRTGRILILTGKGAHESLLRTGFVCARLYAEADMDGVNR